MLDPAALPAATYVDHGHYGFLAVTRDEVGAAVTFDAALMPTGATNAPGTAIRSVHAVPVAGGWQVYVGGWPAGVRGVCDLALRARAVDGSQRTVTLPGTVTVASERMDVALLLDDSFSMRRTDPTRLRVAAVQLFARVAAARGSIRTLTIVAFNRTARVLLPPTDPADHVAIDRSLTGVVAEGSTDMDAAFAQVVSTFAGLPDSRKIAVVLSDGHDQPGRYENAHLRFADAHWPVYTVGLSDLADTNTLCRIATQTGGAYQFAPDTQRLEAIFQEIVLALHGAVMIGDWPLERADVHVPVDDAVRLLTLALDAPVAARCRVSGPDRQARELAADAASNAVCEVYAPQRGPWQVSAATGAVLRATAASDLELVLFPVAAAITDAVPVQVHALLLRDFAPVTGATVRVALTIGAAAGGPVTLSGVAPGRYSGWLVPAAVGAATCHATASGRTPAGWPFQRAAAQAWQVSPVRRDSLWVQPQPATLALYPGTAVTGTVAIAGRGAFSAALTVPGSPAGVAVDLPDAGGSLPDGASRALRVEARADADASPGALTAQVAVAVGTLPVARVLIEITVLTPEVASGPAAFDWGVVRSGSMQTGRIWAALVPGGAVRIRTAADGAAAWRPGEARILSAATSQWEIVVAAPAGADARASGTIVLDWGWGRRTVPWQVSTEPPPVVVEPVVTNAPPVEPPPTNVVALPPVVVEPVPAVTPVAAPAPVPAHRYNWPHLLLIALLALLLAWLLERLLRHTRVHRMTKYFVLSVLLHLAFLLLGLDLLVQTRVVEVEQLSPSLAVRIEALEQKFGVEITPAAAPIALNDAESAAAVARASASATAEDARRAEIRQPDAEVAATQAEQAPTVRPTELAADAAEAAKQRTKLDAAQETRTIEAKAAERAEHREEMRAVLVDAARQEAEPVRTRTDARDAPPENATAVLIAAAVPMPADVRAVAMADTTAKQAGELAPAAATEAAAPAPKQVAAAAAVAVPVPVTPERTPVVGAARGAGVPTRTSPAAEPAAAVAAGSTVVATVAASRGSTGASGPSVSTAAQATAKQSTVAGDLPAGADTAAVAVHRVVAGGAAAEQGPTDRVVPAAVGSAVRAGAATGGMRTGAAAVSAPDGASAAATVAAPGEVVQARAPQAAEPVGDGRAPAKRKGMPVDAMPAAAGAEAIAVHRGVAGVAASGQGVSEQAVAVAAGRAVGTGAATGAQRVGVPAAGAATDAPSATVLAPRVTPGRVQGPVVVNGEGAAPEKRRGMPVEAAPLDVGTVAGVRRVAAPSAGPAAAGGAEPDRAAAVGLARGQRTGGAATERGAADVIAAAAAADPRDTSAAARIDVPRQVGLPGVRGDAVAGDLALRLGDGREGTVSTTLGLARYGGDWDCSKTAMMFLGHQLRERTGMGLMAGDRVVTLDDPELRKLPFVYMTGHRDFQFTDAEVRNLRAYLQGGGHLWADDSTHYRDETFDRAFRRELARLLPGAALEKLGPDFKGFHTGYDLSQGYKGYAIPPGDKYRQDYIEGARLGDRVAVVYTRNDYGDGLDIDPHTQPLEPSLTSLSPAEMQEGATRMGVNLVLYFLTQGGQVDGAFMSRTAQTMRTARDRSDSDWPTGADRAWEGFGDATGWPVETWGDPATWTAAGDAVRLRFEVADKEKAAFGRVYEPAWVLEARDVLAVELVSRLTCGARVALGLTVGTGYFETAPCYVKPGANRIFFRCDARTFKTEAAKWEYREALPLPAAVGKINLLIYAPAGGEFELRNARVIRVP
jgi:hypothetical protein